MEYTQLLYVSKAASTLCRNDIDDILNVATQFNHSKGISGMLSFSGHYFIQCIEGNRSSINQLYNSINRDNRHQDLEILLYQESGKRLFPQWSMEWIPIEAIQNILTGSSTDMNGFSPFNLDRKQILNLLYSLAEYYQKHVGIE